MPCSCLGVSPPEPLVVERVQGLFDSYNGFQAYVSTVRRQNAAQIIGLCLRLLRRITQQTCAADNGIGVHNLKNVAKLNDATLSQHEGDGVG